MKPTAPPTPKIMNMFTSCHSGDGQVELYRSHRGLRGRRETHESFLIDTIRTFEPLLPARWYFAITAACPGRAPPTGRSGSPPVSRARGSPSRGQPRGEMAQDLFHCGRVLVDEARIDLDQVRSGQRSSHRPPRRSRCRPPRRSAGPGRPDDACGRGPRWSGGTAGGRRDRRPPSPRAVVDQPLRSSVVLETTRPSTPLASATSATSARPASAMSGAIFNRTGTRRALVAAISSRRRGRGRADRSTGRAPGGRAGPGCWARRR